jgi:hypothetical protein
LYLKGITRRYKKQSDVLNKGRKKGDWDSLPSRNVDDSGVDEHEDLHIDKIAKDFSSVNPKILDFFHISKVG